MAGAKLGHGNRPALIYLLAILPGLLRNRRNHLSNGLAVGRHGFGRLGVPIGVGFR